MLGRDLGPADLQARTPDEFEQLTYLLARSESPACLFIRNKDRGLDVRLPDALGRFTLRGWQSKRFSTGEVQWAKCVESVETALAFWRPLRITFVFAHDLSAAEQAQFKTRLVEEYPIVRLDYWTASDVLRLLRETEEGQRAAEYLFGPEASLEGVLAKMVGKEPVTDPIDLAKRQAELNRQFDSDPHFYYTSIVRPSGAPETPPAPGSVASFVLDLGGQEVRYDLTERYSGALRDLAGGPTVVARDATTERSIAELLQSRDPDLPVTIESGLGVVWPKVPVGLRGLVPEGEVQWGAVSLQQVDVEEDAPVPLPMLMRAGTATAGMVFWHTPPADETWDTTLLGSTGGLDLAMSLKFDERGKLIASDLQWRHTQGVGNATEQLLAVEVLLEAVKGSTISLEIDTGAEPSVSTFSLADAARFADQIDDLEIMANFLRYAAELQAWLGTPLFPPAQPTREDASSLGSAIAMIRQPMRTGTWRSVDLVAALDEHLADGAELAVLQPVHVEVFGNEHYLGMDVLRIPSARSEVTDGRARLVPGDTDAVSVVLHHPEDVAEEASSRFAGAGNGRILMRRKPEDGPPSTV